MRIRLISLLLVLCMVLGMLPMTSLADVNGDSFVDTSDAALVYRIVSGTLDAFPAN